jgi:hypothetical protein
MADEPRDDAQSGEYEAPDVEDLDSTEGPAVTAAGGSGPG